MNDVKTAEAMLIVSLVMMVVFMYLAYAPGVWLFGALSVVWWFLRCVCLRVLPEEGFVFMRIL